MKKKLIVLDDFYDNAHELREEALSSEFFSAGTYPGKDTASNKFTYEMATRFSEIMGAPIQIKPNTGNFRISLAQDKATRHIHYDSNVHIVNICLTLDKDCKGGIALWKHKETGLEYLTIEKEKEIIRESNNPDILEKKIVQEDGLHEDRFEQTMFVPYRFNRCVIIDGRQLHSPFPQGWGDKPENGRLTQHFFFETV